MTPPCVRGMPPPTSSASNFLGNRQRRQMREVLHNYELADSHQRGRRPSLLSLLIAVPGSLKIHADSRAPTRGAGGIFVWMEIWSVAEGHLTTLQLLPDCLRWPTGSLDQMQNPILLLNIMSAVYLLLAIEFYLLYACLVEVMICLPVIWWRFFTTSSSAIVYDLSFPVSRTFANLLQPRQKRRNKASSCSSVRLILWHWLLLYS